MSRWNGKSKVGLLFSGGVDSAILLQLLLDQDFRVQPIYVRCGLRWEPDELIAARNYLAAVDPAGISPLVELTAPLSPLLGSHWSVFDGISDDPIPAANTPDDEVFLPGRNLLLIAPAALWCQSRGIEELALGTLAANPFADATDSFLRQMESILVASHPQPIRLSNRLAGETKRAIIDRFSQLPLQHTLSCLQPIAGTHCGHCNKCGERRRAFEAAGRADPAMSVGNASVGVAGLSPGNRPLA